LASYSMPRARPTLRRRIDPSPARHRLPSMASSAIQNEGQHASELSYDSGGQSPTPQARALMHTLPTARTTAAQAASTGTAWFL